MDKGKRKFLCEQSGFECFCTCYLFLTFEISCHEKKFGMSVERLSVETKFIEVTVLFIPKE